MGEIPETPSCGYSTARAQYPTRDFRSNKIIKHFVKNIVKSVIGTNLSAGYLLEEINVEAACTDILKYSTLVC